MIEINKDFLPYGKHEMLEEDIQNVSNVLRNKNLTQGEYVPNFENNLAKKVKSKYCIAVNSATSALHIACMALGLKKGDILWTSTNSFVASANCGLYCGAEINFIDINPSNGLMDIELLAKKLALAKSENKLPKIVIPVHFAGSSCDMQAIFSLSKEYGFQIIEDASHAIGGKYNGNFIGNCKYSAITIFSFHPVKIITTGEGGCGTTNDENLARKMKFLRNHGITKEPHEFKLIPKGEWSYEQQLLGFNYRMSDIHAALGISQLKRLDQIVQLRNKKFNIYKDLLKNLPLDLYEPPKNVISTFHLAVIRLHNKEPKYHKKVFNNMKKAGIGVQVHYSPIHLNPYFRELGFKEGDFPKAELHALNSMSIPLYTSLSKVDQIRVSETLKDLL